ncbi:GOLPH3/VPS74 family protein [Rubellicoccus peritrichatus]|uniref:GPP34 family phosphoprotein n=1 Tax=Rubellicoccus peritrichatus TaxID=3080537 RepID=A0AAQ3LBY0_9BACT|nr:GPP34 family phosphoprotein [Puniceicoccus sp. CR14]WOO39319.1 GPP34 family phosphoprotein [Puniceicoccus sp. CR14]
MLRFAEEITLLALNDETGKMHRNLEEQSFECAIAGALLLELAFMNRVDTDVDNLMLLNTEPTGDTLLNEAIAALKIAGDKMQITQAIAKLTLKARDIEPRLLASLVYKGILEEKDSSFLWIKGERTYPMIEGKEEMEVRTRIRKIILTDTIPDPRDIAIISLMEACKLHRTVFVPEELSSCRKKIKQVAAMEFIGQAMLQALEEIKESSLEEIAHKA